MKPSVSVEWLVSQYEREVLPNQSMPARQLGESLPARHRAESRPLRGVLLPGSLLGSNDEVELRGTALSANEADLF
jgi:hypothetical protein